MHTKEVTSFQEGFRRVQAFLRLATLLQVVDGAKGDLHLLGHAYGEVKEVDEAQGFFSSGVNPEVLREFYKELSDVFVFLACWLNHYASSVDTQELDTGIDRLNGHGKHYSSVRGMGEVISDVRNDPTRAIKEIFARMYSIGVHSPLGLHPLSHLEIVLEKVIGNRDPELYSAYEDGVLLSEEECILKYDHLENCTRAMRKVLKRTLRRNDWIPHKHLFLGWRNAKFSFFQLQQVLERRSLLNLSVIPTNIGETYIGHINQMSSGIYVVGRPERELPDDVQNALIAEHNKQVSREKRVFPKAA